VRKYPEHSLGAHFATLCRDRGRPGRTEMRTSVGLSSNDKRAKHVRSVHSAVPSPARRRPSRSLHSHEHASFTVWVDTTSQNEESRGCLSSAHFKFGFARMCLQAVCREFNVIPMLVSYSWLKSITARPAISPLLSFCTTSLNWLSGYTV
jgi:hypothetical protein